MGSQREVDDLHTPTQDRVHGKLRGTSGGTQHPHPSKTTSPCSPGAQRPKRGVKGLRALALASPSAEGALLLSSHSSQPHYPLYTRAAGKEVRRQGMMVLTGTRRWLDTRPSLSPHHHPTQAGNAYYPHSAGAETQALKRNQIRVTRQPQWRQDLNLDLRACRACAPGHSSCNPHSCLRCSPVLITALPSTLGGLPGPCIHSSLGSVFLASLGDVLGWEEPKPPRGWGRGW